MDTAERYFLALDALLLVIWQEHRVILAPRVLFDVDEFMERMVLRQPPITDHAFLLAAQTAVNHIMRLVGRRALSRSAMRLLQLCWRMELRRMLIAAAHQHGADHPLP